MRISFVLYPCLSDLTATRAISCTASCRHRTPAVGIPVASVVINVVVIALMMIYIVLIVALAMGEVVLRVVWRMAVSRTDN